MVKLSDMTDETSQNASTFDCITVAVLLKHFKNELRPSLSGDFYWVPLEYGRGEVAHQSL